MFVSSRPALLARLGDHLLAVENDGLVIAHWLDTLAAGTLPHSLGTTVAAVGMITLRNCSSGHRKNETTTASNCVVSFLRTTLFRPRLLKITAIAFPKQPFLFFILESKAKERHDLRLEQTDRVYTPCVLGCSNRAILCSSAAFSLCN